jgi:hypothetical protein
MPFAIHEAKAMAEDRAGAVIARIGAPPKEPSERQQQRFWKKLRSRLMSYATPLKGSILI